MLAKMGVDESRWAPRSSKPLAGRVAGRGGFDSHALPPKSYIDIKGDHMNYPPAASDPITSIVEKILTIQDITHGKHDDNFLLRYRGELRLDAESGYDQISDALEPHQLTPTFRNEEGMHVVSLMKGRINPSPSNPRVNLIFFVLTLFSVVLVGTINSYQGPVPEDAFKLLGLILKELDTGLPFGLSLLGILLAHEFGHYLAARYHKTSVTLPYFIPLPIPPFGTLGAFIQLKSPPKNRRVLHDIGVSGPLAGLLVAIPILLIGLSLSDLSILPIALSPGEGFSLEGNSFFYLLAKYLVHGEFLPQPASYGSLSPLVYWVKFFFTGQPIPLGGKDVMLHPMAFAGWAGLLVTALNLIPAGQLDGGHSLYVLFGEKAKKVLPVILVLLILLGFVWPGWWLWAMIIYTFGQVHAEPLDQITELNPARKVIAAFTLVLFFLLFVPVPLTQIINSIP